MSNKIAQIGSKRVLTREELEPLYYGPWISITNIAKELHTTVPIVKKYLQEYGMSRPEYQAPKRIDLPEEVLEFTEEKLYEEYVIKGRGIAECARLFGCSHTKIKRHLDRQGWRREYSQEKYPELTKELLEELYVTQGKNRREISEETGVPMGTVSRRLQFFKIKKPTELLKEAGKKRMDAITPQFSEEELRRLYLEENKSMREMSELLGISEVAVWRRLKSFGIKKSKEEVWGKMRQTNKERYGVENPFCSSFFQEKAKQTRIERTGFAHPKYKGMNPEVVEMIWDRDKFRDYVKAKGYQTTKEIAEDLDLEVTTVAKIVGRLDSWDLINTSRSRQEIEIQSFLDSIGVKAYHDRKIIHPYEIDMYAPDYKIGIEFNGDYYHNEFSVHDKNYHKMKSQKATEVGVFIYHIFEYEWAIPELQEKIKYQLINLFGKNNAKIAARDCEVKEVGSRERINFLEENHLQGADKASVAYGLYYNNQLVALMSFGCPRFNHNYDWELLRFCCKKNYSIMGGASKLFKHFLKNYTGSIISYSNAAKTRGSLYERLGFEFLKDTVPSYVWVQNNHPGNFLTRFQTQMPNEVAIMHEKGYARVYDCGTKVWIYNR